MIIDDERLARSELRRMLESFPRIDIVGEAVNADEALQKIDEHGARSAFSGHPDARKNGFELLSSLEGKVPDVIFTTAYDEYALKAFEF